MKTKNRDRALFAVLLAVATVPFVVALTMGPEGDAYAAHPTARASGNSSASSIPHPSPPTSGSAKKK